MYRSKRFPGIQFSPRAMLVHGLVILPAFVLQENLFFRGFQTLLFVVLSLLYANFPGSKKKYLVFTILSFLFIVVFQIITPFGEVLLRVFMFPVTAGAVKTGIYKATVFTGLISLSKITIMKDLTLPGRAGEMFSRIFYYFKRLNELQGKFKTKDIIQRIDLILLDISALNPGSLSGRCEKQQSTSVPVIFLICLSVFFHWGLLVFSWFFPGFL
jgi:hypothetical protein